MSRTTKRILSLLLAFVLLLGLLPQVYAAETPAWDTDGDGTLEILTIGNSFSVDAMEYVWQIANALGVEKIALGNLYIGGCALSKHAANAAEDKAAYTYYYNESGTWVTTKEYKMSTALTERSWDFVSMQQRSNDSGLADTYNKDLTDLVAYVKEKTTVEGVTAPKLVWHMTWAYQQDSTHSAFKNYGNDQMTMYNGIVNAAQTKILTNADFSLVIANGTAVQNARTSMIGDHLTRDGYHMTTDFGRYLTGLNLVHTLTGLPVDGITYAPEGVSALQKQIAIEAINNTADTPYAVTESVYHSLSGYTLLDTGLTQCAYWNSTDSSRYQIQITGNSTAKKNYATVQLTREDIPVGSVIVLEEGWKYRPDGWINPEERQATSGRPAEVKDLWVKVTEEWWGDFTVRAFNINKVAGGSLESVDVSAIADAFRIYVPMEEQYRLVDLPMELTKGGFWNSTEKERFNTLITDESNSHKYFATKRFTKEELPVGSVITIAEGWRYRPDGWVDPTQRNSSRPGNVTTSEVTVTEEWWADYTLRGFNISKTDGSSLAEVDEAEVAAAFRIQVPVQVLYEEDFEDCAGTLTDGENAFCGLTFYNPKAGTAQVKDGVLSVSSPSGGYPLIYVTGKDFSDYTVELDLTYTDETASGSWAGLAFNVGGDTTYFNGKVTMANKASINGRINNAWGVDVSGHNKGISHAANITTGQTVRFKVVTKANTATLYLAGYTDGVLGEYSEVMTITNIPEANQSGSVGVNLSNKLTAVTVDNILVTANPVVHTCQWSETYSYDETHHWQTCGVCYEIGNKAEHSFEADACVCGYVRELAAVVVYEENFDSYTEEIALADGVNYNTGWVYANNSEGSAVIRDGKLYVRGSAYDVLYRDGGSTWGNYTVEADFCYETDNKGWGGLLYNVQSGTKFQKGSISLSGSAALNGRDSGWSNDTADNKVTMETAPAVGEPFRMKIDVEGRTATLSYAMLNGDGTKKTDYIQLLTIDNIPADAQTGSVGFMTSSGSLSSFWVDNILVTERNPVVFTEDFDYENTVLTANAVNETLGLNFIQNYADAAAEIKDGKLVFTGANCDAVLFEAGRNWTNYTVEADVSYTAETSGWGGLLFRTVDSKNFQKAAVALNDRANLNGRVDGAWYKNSEGKTVLDFANDLAVGEEFRLKVVVEENTAELYYARYTDGVLGDYVPVMSIADTFADIHMTGTVGMILGSSNGTKVCSMTLDNLVVSHGTDRMQTEPEYPVAEIYVPETGIVNPPVVIQKLTDSLPNTVEGPAVALMEIDESLNILGENGQVLAAAADFAAQCGKNVIPAFIVDSEAEATALNAFLKEQDIIDAFVAATEEHATLIKQVRTSENGKYLRGVLICDSVENKKELHKLAANSLANVLLCEQTLTVDDVNFFVPRELAVWSCADDAAGVYSAIAAGWTGAVTVDPGMVYDIYESITTTTVSGEPVIIAHRGHTGYPENTLLSFQKAMEAGCLAVETDLRLSKDGQIVLMHDTGATSMKRTTGIEDTVENYTAAELTEILVNIRPYNEADITDENGNVNRKLVNIPTFESVLQMFGDTDMVFYCHMEKADDTVAAFNALMEKYPQYKDQVVFFISWSHIDNYNYSNNTDGLAYAAGNSDSLLADSDDLVTIEKFIRGMTPYNYQPLFYDYTEGGHGREDYYYKMSARGYLNSHSTTNGQDKMDRTFLTEMGATGALTDNVPLTANYSYYVDAADQLLYPGEAIDLTQTVRKVEDKYSAEEICGFVQLSGPQLVETEAGFTLNEYGEVTLVYYADTTGGAVSYRVYGAPVTVTFADSPAVAEVEGKINAIGKVTLDSKAAIEAARAAYEDLTDAKKARVTNLAVLEKAEEVYRILSTPVALTLKGAASVRVDDTEIVYTLSAENMTDLATVLLYFDYTDELLSDPVVEAAEGWYVVYQEDESGRLFVSAANNTGASGEGDILTVTMQLNGQPGEASVKLTEVQLAAFIGSEEGFVPADLTKAAATTKVEYSTYDLNRDGAVNLLDMTYAQRFYGTAHKTADLNGDGDVNINDFILILNNFSDWFV